MLYLGTWIRECDEADFQRFFSLRPEMVVHNARRKPVDIAEMDGLLISGGPDIDAAFHHERPDDVSLIINPEPERDRWEFGAVLAACERGLPMLCICKGVQVLNVALGGTLHLHIEGHNAPEMKIHNVQPLRYSTAAHHRFPLVNSSHHQALDRLGEGLGSGGVERVRSGYRAGAPAELSLCAGRPISPRARYAIRQFVRGFLCAVKT
jgi:putative glutamine amidotransferase